MKVFKLILIFGGGFFFLNSTFWINTVYPQSITETKLIASDGAAKDNFGYIVSISGDYAIIGAFADSDNGDSSGSAYIFKRDGTSWIEQTKLTAGDGAEGDMFGISVSISGDYAIVGAWGDDDKGNNSGSAYIFKREGTSWSEQTKLLASDGAEHDWFGYIVSISGDYAIVGALGDNDESGSAYVFKRDGTSWTKQTKLTASDGAEGDRFGISVSISGDYAIIGAYWDDDKGSAYIFKRDGTSWIQQPKLTAGYGAAGDAFGVSVSISGDYAIVGAGGDSDKGTNSGAAYIIKREGTSWTEQTKLLASDGTYGDHFGGSVSMSGDYAIIGASGAAYIFKRDGIRWIEQTKLLASDGAQGDHFGSCSISGDYAIVGASGDNDNGSDSGSAYIYNGFIVTAIKQISNNIPNKFMLYQNHPNPFNPTTNITFDLPNSGYVTLKVYNALGKEALTLVSENMQAGRYSVKLNAKGLASGVYFYKLQTESFVQIKKMLLVR